MEIPAGLNEPARAQARAAVNDAFRGAMLTASGLALLASLSGWWLIRPQPR